MHDAHDGTSKVFAEQERAVLERKREVAEVVAQHLGPQASAADQSYVARFAEFGRAGRRRRSRSSGLPMIFQRTTHSSHRRRHRRQVQP